MRRRGQTQIGICRGCGKPFVTVVHQPILGSVRAAPYHEEKCGACKVEQTALSHLAKAKRLQASVAGLRQRIARNARKFDARIPHCKRCAEGKPCGLAAQITDANIQDDMGRMEAEMEES